MTTSRLIKVTRWIPNGTQEFREVAPIELVFSDAKCGYLLLEQAFPPIERFNRLLLSGRGDDGFIPHTWDSFTLTEQEYHEIRRRHENAA
jgi:hypothetical protein